MAVKNHTNAYFHIINVIDGKMRFAYKNQERILEKGDMVLIPKGETHRFGNDFDETVRYYQLNFSVLSKPLVQQLKMENNYFISDEFSNQLLSDINQEYVQGRAMKDEFASAALKTLLLHMTKSSRQDAAQQQQIIDTTGFSALSKKVIAFLSENFAEDFSLDDVAANVGITKNYLCNAFKHNTGTTINACLNMIRIRKAAELIVYSDLPLPQVSQMCGYVSVSHFNRVFMRYVGLPPGQCRRAFSFDNLTKPSRSPGSFMYSVLANKSITSDVINEFEKKKD